MTAPIYLDHLASTPLDPAVLAAMLPWLDPAAVGNPHAATHRAGWRAAEAVERARGQVAALIGARPGEIVFTSGATEANNLALLGAAPAGWPVAASAIEHASVTACLPVLAARGHETHVVPVDGTGRLDSGALVKILERGPVLVSVMSANNEIGTLQPVAEIGTLCRRAGAIFYSDAVQSPATAVLDVRALGIDLLSLSGHKLYGPMGIGALYIRDELDLKPLLQGGGQQEGRRPGTVPVALAVGFGAACALAAERCERDAAWITTLRERLWTGLAAALPGLRRNSPQIGCLPGCLNVAIPGIDAADLLLDLPDLAIATGSACASGGAGPSPVLTAIGLSPDLAHGSLRFGLGRGTTEDEIDRAVTLLAIAIGRP
ncbi:MAG: cysteine desulfurase family protein [Aliidongia sp.]